MREIARPRIALLPRIRRRRAWLLWLVLPIVVAALDLALLNRVIPETLSVDVGARGDEAMVRDAWKPEQDGEGVTYRWTSALTVVAVQSPLELPGAELLIELGGVPYNAKPSCSHSTIPRRASCSARSSHAPIICCLRPSPSPDSASTWRSAPMLNRSAAIHAILASAWTGFRSRAGTAWRCRRCRRSRARRR